MEENYRVGVRVLVDYECTVPVVPGYEKGHVLDEVIDTLVARLFEIPGVSSVSVRLTRIVKEGAGDGGGA